MCYLIISLSMNNFSAGIFCGVIKSFKRVWQNKIVAVHEVNVFVACIENPGISLSAFTMIFFMAKDTNFFVIAVKFLAKIV